VSRIFRVPAVALVALAAVALTPSPASAHPLGNFSVNRYSGVVVTPDAVRIDHVLDLAEIPTAQARRAIDRDGDGTMSAAELTPWAASRCAEAAEGMDVHVGGQATPVTVRSARAVTADGVAGLPTLRVECAVVGAGPISAPTRVTFVDRAADDHVGWREVTARGDAMTLVSSDVPQTSRSARLTQYPDDLLSSPLDVRGAQLEVRPGGPRLSSSENGDDVAPRLTDRLAASVAVLVGAEPTLMKVLAATLVAVLVGAAHAVAPGHGKTVMAFYLASRRERRVRSALTVGLTVTATHTTGVLALGLLVASGAALAPERAYPWLTVVSGLLITSVGATLVRDAVTARGRPGAVAPAHAPVHAHSHGAGNLDTHPHDHVHAHGHPHRHDGPGRSGLVAMGVAGGLLPSPSALVVLLATLALGQPWLGVLLVIAFGAGMALTLTATGLLVTRLRDAADRMAVPPTLVTLIGRMLPTVFAAGVVLLGVLLAARGLWSAV
jgi:nickel/cobalt exporter